MSATRTVSLRFGAMAPKIGWQLATQGLKFVRVNVRHAQRDSDAITRLLIRNLISAGVADKARKKLIRDITLSVKA